MSVIVCYPGTDTPVPTCTRCGVMDIPGHPCEPVTDRLPVRACPACGRTNDAPIPTTDRGPTPELQIRIETARFVGLAQKDPDVTVSLAGIDPAHAARVVEAHRPEIDAALARAGKA